MFRLSTLALVALILTATAATAVITKLTPLAEVLESDQYIFVAKVEKLDRENKERPTATFKLEKKLKGEVPFERLPVNMTGDDEAKKAGDTEAMFDRFDETREFVFFIRRLGKVYNAKVFVEGTWFSVYGQLDADGKTVRWSFLHGEPFLRRTFKGTTAEMIKTIEDSFAKKAKPPEPDEMEKPGYGPPVEKKSGMRTPLTTESPSRLDSTVCLAIHPQSRVALFGVIPSFALAAPLAIIAALFPGVFARMAVGMKRWRAFLVVASINSTLALVYWAMVIRYFPHWFPSSRWLGPQMFTVYLLVIALVGLFWAGRRYRRMAAADPAITGTPRKTELYSLIGLTAFAAICVGLSAYFASWSAVFDVPLREFTFIGLALLAATLYAGYRFLSRSMDGAEPPMRLSLSGEAVGLGVLAICGLAAVIELGAQTLPTFAVGTQKGEAEGTFGPRLTGDPVAIVAHEMIGNRQEQAAGRILSNLVLDGDRLYFGCDAGGKRGWMVGMNRHSGEVEWSFADPGLLPVFCTPTIANGKLYCGEGLHEDKGCRLFCLNLSDGTSAWPRPFKTKDGHTEGTPIVANGKVYFPAGDDGLYCANADTGELVWQFPGGKETGIHIDAPPAMSNGTIFVGSGLYTYVAVAIDAETGKEKWRTDLKLRAFGAPLVSGDKVYYGVGTGNMAADVYPYPEEDGPKETVAAGAVVCLNVADGAEVWRYPLPKSGANALAADAFNIYATCRDGCVYALDRKSGKLRWQTGIGSSIMSGAAVAESGGFPLAVYAVSREGRVYCLNPQTGEEFWSWQVPLPGFRWTGNDHNIMCTPLIVTTPTATGSKRTIYIGAMLVDQFNPNKMTIAVFKFEDVIGD